MKAPRQALQPKVIISRIALPVKPNSPTKSDPQKELSSRTFSTSEKSYCAK